MAAKRQAFVPSEDKILRALWARNSAADLAELLGRNVASVTQRAHHLQLRKDPDYITRLRSESRKAYFARQAPKPPAAPTPAKPRRQMARWTAKEDLQLRALVVAGLNPSQIGKAMGRCRGVVWERIARLGLADEVKCVKRQQWTLPELELLDRHYPDMLTAELAQLLNRRQSQVHQAAAKRGLVKSEAFKASDRSGRILRGKQDPKMIASRFPKGHVPANKGTRRPGFAAGRMKETQFKPGQLAGAARAKLLPIGAEVVDSYGYRKRKIRDDAAPNMARLNWQFCHILVWEAAHGPVPAGHCLAFKNGDKTDIRLDNLELLTRRERMLRNTIHNYPRELVELVQLRGALVRKINRRSKQREEQSSRSA